MTMFHGPNDPVYTISVAARLLQVTPHFLRQVEGEGLVAPARTDSNIRLYSENDLRVLAKIIHLMRDCGVNIQGVRVILAMEEGESGTGAAQNEVRFGPESDRRFSPETSLTPDRDNDLVKRKS